MKNYDKLLSQIEKRIKTTMIGSLAKMENNFGHLWGHFKDGPLTKQEEDFEDLWDFTRNQILNQGNAQIRNLREDFVKYGTDHIRQTYSYNFGQPKNT